MLNNASFAKSVVGRAGILFGGLNLNPLLSPPTILTYRLLSRFMKNC